MGGFRSFWAFFFRFFFRSFEPLMGKHVHYEQFLLVFSSLFEALSRYFLGLLNSSRVNMYNLSNLFLNFPGLFRVYSRLGLPSY